MGYMNENLERIHPQIWQHGDISHPPSIFKVWRDDELAAVGIYRVIHEAVNPPAGFELDRFDYAIDEHIVRGRPAYREIVIPVPDEVPGWMLEVAIREAGHWDAVWDAIQARIGLRIAIDRGTVKRSGEIAQVLSEIGLSQDEIDDIFREAGDVEA